MSQQMSGASSSDGAGAASLGSSHDAVTALAIGDNPKGPADTQASASPPPRASPPPGFRPAFTRNSSSLSSVVSSVSVAGPDLPVRFSPWSIASTGDSSDPFSLGESAGGSGEDLNNAQSTLTSASFRQRADKDRSFTASAPPGARPPDSRGPSATRVVYGDDNDGDGIDGSPRREAVSSPATIEALASWGRPYTGPEAAGVCRRRPRPSVAWPVRLS